MKSNGLLLQIKKNNVLNPIFLGGVWFIIHRYCFSHFHFEGWVGGLSQMKLTSFEKKSHFETIPKKVIVIIQ
jgi:hypothetical protein